MADPPVTLKCLVWDLDNTLWCGTLLEDGVVQLTDAVRRTIVELDSRGILQSISSKNDYELATSWLEKFGIAEYFVLPEIGWGPKSAAIRRIADQLKFAYSTVAFIDDQPVERAEVASALPDVQCYPAHAAAGLTELPEFRPRLTQDARRRRQMCQAGFRRDAARNEFAGPDEQFLRSLELVMQIGRASEEELARVEELTLRTSQMNATGVHYSEATLRMLLADPLHEVLIISMADRFGPHGAVGLALLEKHTSVWHLKLLATSCRVVSFGAGGVILRWLIDEAAKAGAHLAADFRCTERNRIMEVAYRFAGFTNQACQCLQAIADSENRGGIQLLHLEPTAQTPPAAIRLIAPNLGETMRTGVVTSEVCNV
ncbi:MAG: HAD-IIIC family phosphatase [Gammaproteobacteria bacterium]